ncbi:DoxX family protein [Robertkochia solimangrovi]|uniref:DoxX family protein n=1 Tax=Robertkochia solimangrovi TaxID=2213046 RepID=UPI00117C81B7|nr:DoxX family protein [Robertkochia solimangrovi]TRZ42946.1 hypothetical protein DMZ48_12850 [Robertkochia solimangrovi]
MTTIISVNSRSVKWLRVLVSGIFIVAGFNHLWHTEKTAQRIASASFGDIVYYFGNPDWLVILSGMIMLIAGVFFLFGYKTQWTARVLIAVLIPITLTIQVGQIETLGPLFKNIAILGGLLFFSINDTEKLLK